MVTNDRTRAAANDRAGAAREGSVGRGRDAAGTRGTERRQRDRERDPDGRTRDGPPGGGDAPAVRVRPARPDADAFSVVLADGSELDFRPGSLVRTAEYDGRVYRFEERSWEGVLRFEAATRLDPLRGFAVSEERFAADLAAGAVVPVEGVPPAARLRSALSGVVARLRALLTPPEKGAVPDWMK